MNYTQLTTAIEDYTENTFTANELATFVQNAEQRIYNTVQFAALRKNVTGSTTTGNKYVACPSDLLSVYSMAVVNGDGDYEYLLDKDVNFIRQAYPSPSDTGSPAYYALFGPQSNYPNELTFILGPTPNGNYVIELHYFYYPESIVTANTTWLGDNFESVLLYGSLLEAAAFMKSDADTITYYKDRYTEALALLQRLGNGLERGDAYRDGQTKLNTNLKGNVVA